MNSIVKNIAYTACLSAVFFVFSLHDTLSQPKNLKLNPNKSLTQFPISSWNMDDGMPSDMVIGLAQDSVGYIWIATYKGISRFDGVAFTNYNHSTNPAIKSVTTQAIATDSEGSIWFGSQQGIVRYKNAELARVDGLAMLDSVSVESLFYHEIDSSLWIGTTSKGVFRFKNCYLEPVSGFFEFAKGIVKAIGSDSNGSIWIGTEGGKVVRYKNNGFATVPSHTPLGGVNSFYFINNDVFVAAENGLFVFSNQEFVNFIPSFRQKVNAVFFDQHSSLWMGTDNGVYRYFIDTRRIESLTEDSGIPNNLVKAFLVDKEGSLWVGTYRKGLFKLSDGIISNISEAEGLSSDIIVAITQIDSERYLIADEYGSLNVLSNKGVEEFHHRIKLSVSRLKHLFTDTKRNIWISTYGGLVKLMPNGEQQVFTLKTGFPAETIRLTFEDSDGNIWIGTRSNGLFKLKPNGKVIEFSLNNGMLSSNYIMAINQDLNGRMVIATKNGLNIISNDKLAKVIDTNSGLPSDFAFNVHIDSGNVYWLSSNDGLIRIENDTSIFVYNIQNGLFDNTLFDILEDDYGFFWTPTDIGIARLSKYELNSFAKGEANSYSYKVYSKSDGMKNERCTGATKSFKSNDGRLFFNTTGGVAIVDPSKLMTGSEISEVYFEKVSVDGDELPQSTTYSIKPGSNRISIAYTAFYYKNPENLRFRYKLSPFDTDWVYAGSSRYSLYTNIPPGSYSFRVQVSLREDEWPAHYSEISIDVEKWWWQTLWFQIGFAFAIALLLFSFVKYRTIAVRRQKIELERIVKERTAQIEQQNIELENQSEELEKLSIVARHTNNAVLIASPNGDVQWVNESFTRIYGYTLEEFIRDKGSNLARISSDPSICYIIEKCINEKVPTSYSLQVTTKDNLPLWIQTNLTPIKDSNGEVREIVAIDTDISELKQVESEMIAMNDEIISQTESIMKQNEAIQAQRDELEQVNNLLIKHTQNIEASIWYAHTIQKAILPAKKNIDQFFSSFIVFKPRDIVSGDFYWFTQLPSKPDKHWRVLVAVVDCTGHGVPGALMSIIGSRLLSEIVTERHKESPSDILFQLNRLVNIVLKQESEENIDGMDVALCLVESSTNHNFSVTFSGANRPLYVVKKDANEVLTIKGSRKTIGGIMPDLDAEFENHHLNLKSGDRLFMSSDGYIDQNGMDDKKFTVARLHAILLENSLVKMEKLGEVLDVKFDEYRGKMPQRDDATILGIEL